METLPLCACCQRSPGLYTAAPASRAARRSPRGARRGAARPGRSPGSAAPAPGGDAFEERRCPLPQRGGAPGCDWSRLVRGGGGRSALDKPPPPAPRCWRLAGPVPAGCDGRLPPPAGRGGSLPSPPEGCPPRGWGLRCRPPVAAPAGILAPPGPSTRSPPRCVCVNLGIPAPLLHMLTSATRHRSRSTLPGKPPSPRAPRGPTRGRDAAARQVRGGRRGATLNRASPHARAHHREGPARPRGAGTAHGSRMPARPGTAFRGGPPAARPRPSAPSLHLPPPPRDGEPPQPRDLLPAALLPSSPRSRGGVPAGGRAPLPACGRPFPGQGRGGHPGAGRGTRPLPQPPTPRPVGGCSSPASPSVPRTHRATLARVGFFPLRGSANTQPLSRGGEGGMCAWAGRKGMVSSKGVPGGDVCVSPAQGRVRQCENPR